MFTGIIETIGTVTAIENDQENIHFYVESLISNELKVDQSVSHNGVCLTVVKTEGQIHTVTAISETLHRTNLGRLKVGDPINLERAMIANARLDGHIVQGHVDKVCQCVEVHQEGGSWSFRFELEQEDRSLIVHKGSVCLNGVSLTVVEPDSNSFSVAIIPFTFEHTNFHRLKSGDFVNIEFDMIGKYIARQFEIYKDR